MEDCDSSLGKLDKLTRDEVNEIIESYNAFCNATQSLLLHDHISFTTHQFVSHVHTLCKHGLQSLLTPHFLKVLEVRSYSTNHFTLSVYKFNSFTFYITKFEFYWPLCPQETFERNGALRFWQHFVPYAGLNNNDDINVSVCLWT